MIKNIKREHEIVHDFLSGLEEELSLVMIQEKIDAGMKLWVSQESLIEKLNELRLDYDEGRLMYVDEFYFKLMKELKGEKEYNTMKNIRDEYQIAFEHLKNWLRENYEEVADEYDCHVFKLNEEE